MVKVLYEEAKERFALKKPETQKRRDRNGQRKKGGPSRRETKIHKLRGEKKKLRTRWLEAEESQKQGLKSLYEKQSLE